jgi:DNA-directed RNA polymerase specialized sigma subunit
MNSLDFPETALAVPEMPLSENIQKPLLPERQLGELSKTQQSADLKALYDDYVLDPQPQKLFGVVNKLSPLIGNTLAQLGEPNNSLLKNEAMLLVADSVKTYDPSQGVALQTWASNQLKQLRRKKRELNSVVKLPERVQLDAFQIERGTRELTDLNGEEPDLEQLSDYIKMPIKRINKVRSMLYKTPDSGAISADAINQSQTDNTDEAMHYVYADANKVDRKIMEHRLGFGGSKPMTNNEIASMLGVGPDVVSKRLSRIIKRVEETYNVLAQ